MPELIPPGAFDKAAANLTRVVKREDGTDVTAFAASAKAQTAMRTVVNTHEDRLAAVATHEDRLAAVELEVSRLPFPFRGSSSPGA